MVLCSTMQYAVKFRTVRVVTHNVLQYSEVRYNINPYTTLQFCLNIDYMVVYCSTV